MPTSNPNTNDHQHEPLLALLALTIAYFLLNATIELKHSLIDTILLRSFPAWANHYSITKPDQPPHWLRRLSPSALTALLIIASLRIWKHENLWKLVAKTTSWFMLFSALSVAGLWGFERVLLWSHKIADWSGWVPFDEPEEAYLRREEHQRHEKQLGKHQVVQSEDRKKPYTSDDGWDGKTRMFLNSISKSPARCYDQACRMVASWTSQHGYSGTQVQASTGVETYHSITADEKYQATSFEELRLEYYQEHDSGARAVVQEERSLLGKSISFLNDSLFGSSSLTSRDSFGRTTVGQGALLLDDDVAAAQTTERQGRIVVPDLLTGTPRKLFT